jgi:HK97 family phage prohead protease
MSEQTSRPPRDNLIRARMPGVELRAVDPEGNPADVKPTLFGHFARFNEWTEIDSMWEGRFMERFAPGSFKKTLREQGDRIRVLLEHGHDPQLGNKPIASPDVMREDDEGVYYEASLFDGLPPLVMDGLRAGQYGASHRFRVMREEIVDDPGASEFNPNGLPERTIKEAQLREFGPVTWGAYDNATAGVRSLTDDFLLRCFAEDPARLKDMFDRAADIRDRLTDDTQDEQEAPSDVDAAADEPHLDDERREQDDTEPAAPVRTTPRPSLTSTAGRTHTLNSRKGWRLP